MAKSNIGGSKMSKIKDFLKKYRSLVLLSALAIIAFACEEGFSDISNDSKTAGSGKGGSMARMTIVKNFLYAVDGSNLKIFNISQPQSPVFTDDVEIGRSIETIFGFKNHLYIGSTNAVYIYNIDDPVNPYEVTMIQHMLSCDPVVANDTVAFSTIRTTSACRWNTWSVNELLVLDVSDMSAVHQSHGYQLDFSPYGLGLKDTTLFLCKGEAGIDLYDIRELADGNNFQLNSFNHISGVDAFDVIVYNDMLMVVGEDGFIMYDITDLMNIKKLSEIKPD